MLSRLVAIIMYHFYLLFFVTHLASCLNAGRSSSLITYLLFSITCNIFLGVNSYNKYFSLVICGDDRTIRF